MAVPIEAAKKILGMNVSLAEKEKQLAIVASLLAGDTDVAINLLVDCFVAKHNLLEVVSSDYSAAIQAKDTKEELLRLEEEKNRELETKLLVAKQEKEEFEALAAKCEKDYLTLRAKLELKELDTSDASEDEDYEEYCKHRSYAWGGGIEIVYDDDHYDGNDEI